MNAAAEASLILILRTSLAAALSRRLGVSLCGPNSPQRRRGRQLDQTRIRPRPDAFGQPALRRCNLSQLGCIFACRTASLGLLTEPPAQFLEGPYFLAAKRLLKLIKYMPFASPSDPKVPKSLAFIAVLGLGLLLIAAVAFVPNSSAGLSAFHNGGSSGSKRSRPEFVAGEALVRFKSDRAFEGSRYMPVPSEGAPQRFGENQSLVGHEEILVQID